MFVLLDILYVLGFLFYLPVMLLRGKWHGGFRQRFGHFDPDDVRRLASGRNIWVHAVSVGEVMAVGGLLKGLRARYPDHQLVLSVATITGHALARRDHSDHVLLLWAPLDFSWVVRRYIKNIQPKIYIAAETELWPNLFRCLSGAGVPIAVVNGRISDEAFKRYHFFRRVLRGTVARARLFCMQSPDDASRIKSLGAADGTVEMVGNIKFDNIPDDLEIRRSDLGLGEGQLALLGGSTHSGEEDALIDIFCSLRGQHPLLRLVLAPRHPERAAQIANAIRKRGLNPVYFSSNKTAIGPADVLIVDVIGKLLKFYAASTVVFVGKSLTVQGGHNIIEPAVFGKPIVVGPHMGNFRDIAQAFLAEQAVLQVQDVLELKRAVADLLENPRSRQDLGDRARKVVSRNRGATQRTLGLIERIWK